MTAKPNHTDLNDEQIAFAKNAVYRTWEAIGSDMPEDTDNKQAIECVFDADYMITYTKAPEVKEQFSALHARHGYTKVLNFFAKKIRLC